MPLHRQVHPSDSDETDVYATRAMDATIPKHRIPRRGLTPGHSLAARRRRADARRQRPAESRNVLPDVVRRRDPQADGPQPRQEHDRQGRVSGDGRDRKPMRAYARAPMELAGRRNDDRMLDDRLERSRDARRPRAQMEVARSGARSSASPADKPNIVTGPVQVCWHKFARYFDVELREVPLERDRLGMTPEEVVKPRRREHDRRRADLRRHVHLPVRTRRANCRSARRSRTRDGARHSDSRRRRLGRIHRAVRRARDRLGFPLAARALDQRLRATSSAWRRWASAG